MKFILVEPQLTLDRYNRYGEDGTMKLRTYLTETETSVADFASAIGVSVQAVHRYMNDERMPVRSVRQKIREVTSGRVTADDFDQCAQDVA